MYTYPFAQAEYDLLNRYQIFMLFCKLVKDSGVDAFSSFLSQVLSVFQTLASACYRKPFPVSAVLWWLC